MSRATCVSSSARKHPIVKGNTSPAQHQSPSSYEKKALKQLREVSRPPIVTLLSTESETAIQIDPSEEVISGENSIRFSIVIPVPPSLYEHIPSLLRDISDFIIDKEYSVSDVILVLSETTSDKCKHLQNLFLTSDEPFDFMIKIIGFNHSYYLNHLRNRGKREAKGDWIVFLNPKDLYHPQKLHYIYQSIIREPKANVLVHQYKEHSSDPNVLSNWKQSSFEEKPLVKPELRNHILFFDCGRIHYGVPIVRASFSLSFPDDTRHRDIEFSKQAFIKDNEGVYLIANELMMQKL
jgi:hypothetical protein